MASTTPKLHKPEAPDSEPVLFAYDGSELAELAIEQAGDPLTPGRTALVLCVWQAADVGSYPSTTDTSTPRTRPR